ncbi:MAG: hypothetical protein KF729_36850 [Sandaracinaceae bacterium]|nr:hypothetical protein [Sandaracinaceae bacterium]
MRARSNALLLAVLCASCGGPSLPAARVVVVPRAAPDDAGLAALAARFYAPDADLAALEADVTARLAQGSGAASLHEMAAHLAELREDDGAAWEHWLRAAADLGSPLATIYLDRALRADLTGAQQAASAALLAELAGGHPSPEVRADAAFRLVRVLSARGELEAADRAGRAIGFVDRFLLIGAFDNDQGRGFFAEHPPEGNLDLDAVHRGRLQPIGWRRAEHFDRAGLVRVADHVSPDAWGVTYLLTHVRAEATRDLELRLTAPSGVRVWLNGRRVVDQERLSRAELDNVIVSVRLHAGWNRLLVKSAHGERGEWTIGARFTEPDGSLAAGLAFDVAPHEPAVAEAEDGAPANRSRLDDVLASIEPPLRRALLAHHDAVRNGYEGDALAGARELLELAPSHPVALYHAAITHWSNDELGRAQDLLNDAVARFPDQAGFLYQRGSFYRERDRYDRAIEDLEAARRLSPAGRFATMALAGTFEARGWREHQCRVLEGAVERWPDSGWATRALAFCLHARGYLDASRALHERADAIEPGHEWNLRRLALLARGREDSGALVRLSERMLALAPWSVEALVEAGDQRRFAGRREEARALYAEAMRRDPAWSEPHHRLGLLAFEQGDARGALAHWTEALARDPENGALADRVDFLRGDEDDPDRRLMPTDERIDEALALAVEVDPGAHTVLLLDDEVTTVQEDGSARRRVTQVSLAATTTGRDELIQSRVPPGARVLRAFSVDPDGRRQEASSIRGGVIRFRGLVVGSRVAVQYAWHAPPPRFLPNHFVGSWYFQGPHRQLGVARWVLQVPAGRELALYVNGPITHERAREGALDVHTFRAANVPPFVSEPNMPPAVDQLALVRLSTLTDWAEYVEWERALLSEVFESNASLRERAQRIVEGAASPRERVDRIYRWVAHEIRYQQDYEDTIAGVRPHSCPVVLERGYGDCKDKAVLMILFARELGIDMHFAVLRTTGAGAVRREVPNQQFNHAIVYVPAQDGIEEGFFLDPTTDGLDLGNLRADDQGATALVLDPSSGAWAFRDIPYQGPERSYFRCDVEVAVRGPEEARAEARCRIRGAIASNFRRAMRNEERAAQVRQNVAHSLFAGSTVTRATTEHLDDIVEPIDMRLELDASSALTAQGAEHRMRVPSPFGLGGLTRLERRRTPLRLGVPDSSRWAVRVEAPRDGRIARVPQDFTVEHACFRVARRSELRGRNATITVEYARTCTEVAPEDYPELRRQAQRAAALLQDEVVLALR